MTSSENILKLFQAIEVYDVEQVERILVDNYGETENIFGGQPTSNIDFVNVRCGPLKIAAIHIASALEDLTASLNLVNLLLKFGANVRLTDRLGRTALHHASNIGNAAVVSRLIEAGANVDARFEVNSWQKKTSRDEVIAQYVQLEFIKKFPLPECWGRTPLHQAVKCGHDAIVRLLLAAHADVNVRDDYETTPILLAGAGGQFVHNSKSYERIVQLLIDYGADVNVQTGDTKTTALHHAIVLKNETVLRSLLAAKAEIRTGACGQTPLHEAAALGWTQALKSLLEHIKVLENGSENLAKRVNQSDMIGRTPLHRAAYAGSRECLLLLLENGGNLISTTSTTNISVLHVILSHIPRPVHFLNEILDKGVTANHDHVNDIHFKLFLDFRLFVPIENEQQMAVVANILANTTDRQQLTIFQHPLLETFLRIKWLRLCWFFYFHLLIQLIFVLSFSIYVLYFIHEGPAFLLQIFRILLLLSAVWLSFHSIMQVVLVPRLYFRQYELYTNIICGTLALAVTTGASQIGEPETWALHATSIGILLAWIQLMLLIGRLPTYGYYALMFSTVLQNVIKVLMTFICLVVGFALSFSVQFHTSEQFQDPWRAIVKTTVMMMGEFEYADMFTDSNNASDTTLNRLPISSRVTFLMFIVLASIVLINLMVGLAVNDIQGLQEEGHVRRISKQADFLIHLERITTHPILHNIIPNCFYKMLNNRRQIPGKLTLSPAQMGEMHDQNRTILSAKSIPISLLESLVELALKNYQEATSVTEQAKNGEKIDSIEGIDAADLRSIFNRIMNELAQLKLALLSKHEGEQQFHTTAPPLVAFDQQKNDENPHQNSVKINQKLPNQL